MVGGPSISSLAGVGAQRGVFWSDEGKGLALWEALKLILMGVFP